MMASLIANNIGQAIIWDANDQYYGLFSTKDGGTTWNLRQHWPIQ